MEAEDISADSKVEEAKIEATLAVVQDSADLNVEQAQTEATLKADGPLLSEEEIVSTVDVKEVIEENIEEKKDTINGKGEPAFNDQSATQVSTPLQTPLHVQDIRKEVENLLFTLEQSHDRRISQLSNSHKEMGSLLHSFNESMKKLEHFEKLDQLKAIEKLTDQLPDRKTLITRYVLTFGLETVKLFLAGLVVVFLLSRETGREIAVKTLPVLGFGNAGQVNLGLKLMMGETTPEDFQVIITNVKKRIDGEIDFAFSASNFLPLNRRLEIISQIRAYSFKAAGVDLSAEVDKKLQERLNLLHEDAIARLGFEQSIAKGKLNTADEENLREIKLLLQQKQYPQLLAKALPFWGINEAISLAAMEGSIRLLIDDPSTLQQIINNQMPGKGKL